jgi:hypothetical protein
VKFFEDIVSQQLKHNQTVCGDVQLCEKGMDGTVFILCDGIGSGVYANIAAISCASRLRELLRTGVSLRVAAELVAASMHKAREAEIPFSAFSVALILSDGHFSVYAYESPEAVAIMNGSAIVLKPVFYTAGYEVVGEVSGVLDTGDSLVLCSDGVTQAGLGRGQGMGIGSQGLAAFINRRAPDEGGIQQLATDVTAMCKELSGGRHEDDTTCAVLHCREASQVTLITGPPAQQSRDADFARDFMAMPGEKLICGSSTAEIVGRELGREVTMRKVGSSFGSPPEYAMEGVSLTTEGAVMLNQVYNILGEPADEAEDGVVERLCAILTRADVVHFLIGNAGNAAHAARLFKQLGVMPRKRVVRLIMDKLRAMGKLVTEKNY